MVVNERLFEQSKLIVVKDKLVGRQRRQVSLAESGQKGLEDRRVVDILEASATPILVDLRVEPAQRPGAVSAAVKAFVIEPRKLQRGIADRCAARQA